MVQGGGDVVSFLNPEENEENSREAEKSNDAFRIPAITSDLICAD